MKCAEFEEIVHELDRPGTKGNELREEALVHAESCGRCGVLLTEVESLDFALAKIANEADEKYGAVACGSRLASGIQARQRKSAARRMQWRMAAIGVAAALFLALGLSLQHHLRPARGLGGCIARRM